MVGCSARLIASELASGWHCLMVTLTYADDSTWLPLQVTEYMDRVEKWALRRGVRAKFIMSMEPSEVGRELPHYHVLIWLPRRLLLPKADRAGWWILGLTQTKVVQCAAGYVSKYVQKETGASLPRGARCCSVRGLSCGLRRLRSFLMLPKYVQQEFSLEDRVTRAAGGGWLSRRTGEISPARWRVVDHAKDWKWITFEPIAVL